MFVSLAYNNPSLIKHASSTPIIPLVISQHVSSLITCQHKSCQFAPVEEHILVSIKDFNDINLNHIDCVMGIQESAVSDVDCLNRGRKRVMSWRLLTFV